MFKLLLFEAAIDFVKMGFVVPLCYDDYWSKLVCVLFCSFSYFRPSKDLSVSALESTASSTSPSTIKNRLYCIALCTFAFILMLLFIDNVPHKEVDSNVPQRKCVTTGTKLSCDFLSSSWYFVIMMVLFVATVLFRCKPNDHCETPPFR